MLRYGITPGSRTGSAASPRGQSAAAPCILGEYRGHPLETTHEGFPMTLATTTGLFLLTALAEIVGGHVPRT